MRRIRRCKDCDDWRRGVDDEGKTIHEDRGTCVYRLRDDLPPLPKRRTWQAREIFCRTHAGDPCVWGVEDEV